MKRHIISPVEVAPGQITLDDLVLDPETPLALQADHLKEDLLSVAFRNGCVLDVGWYPEGSPDGEFGISLSQNPDAWEPFAGRDCRSIPALHHAVSEFVTIAKARNERYPVSGESVGADHVWRNVLVLDPGVPLPLQPGLHGDPLFEAVIGDHVLTIGWRPQRDPSGELVVALKRITEDWEFATETPYRVERVYKPETWQPFIERRCKSLDELRAAVTDLARAARGDAHR